MAKGNSFKASVRSAILGKQTTLIVAVFCVFVFFVDLSFGSNSSAVLDAVLFFISLGCFALMTSGRIKAGKLLLIISTIAVLTINASKEGPCAGSQYIWFAAIIGIFGLFNYSERIYIFFCILLSMGTLLFCDLTNYSALKLTIWSAAELRASHSILLFFSIGVSAFFMLFISRRRWLTFKDKDRDTNIIRRQKSTLKKTNEELDKFTYYASHDLRSPLTSMLGLIEVAKGENDILKIRQLLARQEDTINKLDDYLKDILFLSRSRKSSLEPVALDIHQLIDNILKQFQFMIEEKDFKVVLNIEIGNQKIIADYKRLAIVLNNLISNSIKYIDEAKSENKIEIKVQLDKELLSFSIYDNGLGIKKENLNKVLDIFYYNESLNKGTGLGLYIVKEAIEKLGGKLNISSEYEKYTKVDVFIPVQTLAL